MDSPYSFHDSSMVFHAPVQRRPQHQAPPQGHGVRSAPSPSPLAPPRRDDQHFSRRTTPMAYPPPREEGERSYSPLPALPTVLFARSHLRSMPDHGGLSPIVAPSPTPAYPAPTYRPLTLAATGNSPSTKTSLGFILGGSRAPRSFPSHDGHRSHLRREEPRSSFRHEDTHGFRHLHVRDERSFKEEDDYGRSYAASRYGTHGPSPQRAVARGRLLSESSMDSPSYASSPIPVPRSTMAPRRNSPASVRPVDMVTAPAATETAKKKRKARICTTEGCTKYVVDHGLCIRHGGGKRCYIDGCDCRAQNRGLCWKHGGFTICKIDGCTKRAKSRGICWSHGGGTRCKRDDCSKIAVSNGLCWAHGGGKRCVFGKCRKPASERTNNFCNEHHAQEGQGAEEV